MSTKQLFLKPLSLMLALRYSTGTPQERSLATMAKVCFWSILLGAFSLALVMAVMNGFEKATHEKIQGINADSTMRTRRGEFDLASLGPVLDKNVATIAFWAPSASGHALITSGNSVDLSSLVMLKGIDPAREEKVTTLASMVQQPASKEPLANLVHDNHVLIGSTTARVHGLTIGSTITLFIPNEAQSNATKLALSRFEALVSGIFSTGIDDYDANVVVCDIPFLQTIDPQAQIDTINLKHQPNINEQTLLTTLKNEFDDLEIYSWKELYPALVSALRLEKYTMFFILALIMLVACTNIIALLFMQITQKRGDIAILRALGMEPKAIRRIFIYLGMSMSLLATVVGVSLATLVSYIIDHFQLITLPDIYYVTYLPARMEPQLVLLVMAVIILMSFLATWFATKKIASLNVAYLLRFEA